MLVTLGLFWGLVALELMLWLIPKLLWRRIFGGLLVTPILLVSGLLFIEHPALATGILFVSSLYRLVNLLRLVKARVNEQYLRRSTLVTSLWIIGVQAIVTILWRLNPLPELTGSALEAALSYLNLVAASVLVASTLYHLWKTRPPRLGRDEMSDSHLPTLTVAIPARNETEDLDECLQTLVASDYPKLEILVLDDCSQNKRTPEIIRSFAHDGVRFLQGVVPADNWLAKNQAYQQLYEAANGELILFCGVDVRFAPHSLRLLVAALEHKQKSMISIIPRNALPSLWNTHTTTLLQPMRYAWELALPRRLFRRPPVLSSCWLIKHEVLASAGGFSAVSRSIVPESYFARVSVVHDGYSFMQSSAKLGISSNKSLQEQRSTAVRIEYPRLHRRIELVMLLGIAELFMCVVPYVQLVAALITRSPTSFIVLPGLTVGLLTLTYGLVVALTYRLWLLRSLWLLPFAALYDVFLLHESMVRYEFFSVNWKDRNVCIPVMRVVEPAPEQRSQQPVPHRA